MRGLADIDKSIPLLFLGDVTPRRHRRFRVKPGETFMWTVVGRDGEVLAPSTPAEADEHCLVTMEGVRIARTGSHLVLRRPK